MIGTIMVANVFFVIIPGQRKVVQALRDGRTPDPTLGAKGKLRSVHNTYFTLPVLFTMISNHYAMTFGSKWNWLVLIALCAAGALIRAWFVARHFAAERGGTPPWTLIAGLALLVGTMFALKPQAATPAAMNTATQATPAADSASTTEPASAAAALMGRYERIHQIIEQRCISCHALKPTQPGFVVAPKGFIMETEAQVRAQLPLIATQVSSHVMPIGNLTGMTEEERTEMLGWISDGAPN
jgi:uncharacterized membrane protein